MKNENIRIEEAYSSSDNILAERREKVRQSRYQMRILIYGAGVIGSVFAGKLASAGHDITVLARGERYREISGKGIILQDAYSNEKETCKVCVIDSLEQDDIYDYILVTLQKNQVMEVLPVLAQNKSPNIVLVVNNCLGYDEWVRQIGADRLMLGFPSAGGERSNGAVTYFIGKGAARVFQTTTFGDYCAAGSKRLDTLVKLFNGAKIPAVKCSDMDAWQKTHVAIVTSIGNALYKHNSNNYELAGSKNDIALMLRGIKEGFAVLKKLGYRVTPAKLWYFRLPVWLLAVVFRLVMNSKMAEIAMAKHTIAAKSEMQLLQQDFDILIKKAAIETPSIDILKQYL